MEDGSGPILWIGINITILLILLISCGFLSAAEKAINVVNRNKIRSLAEEGDERAKKLVDIFNKSSNFLTAYLVITMFFGFVFSSVIVKITAERFEHMLTTKGVYIGLEISMIFIVAILSGLFTIFCISYPRQIAVQHSEGVALALSGFATFFSKIAFPFVALNHGVTNILLKITGQKTGIADDIFSEEEVMSMLEVGQETGVIKEEGKKMIDSIFAFDDKLAYEVMTPRTDVFSINIQDESEKYLDELMELRYSRIPVYDEDNDNIIGILNIKDYLIKARMEGFDNVDIKDILRKAYFVPETKNIDALFFELQKTKQHIAILIDEYGGFSGIVTMEDIIEEVMGDIDDEYDKEEPAIMHIDENTYLVDGLMDLDDINEEIGTNFESESSETLGGLIIDVLGEIPNEDEEESRVVKVDNCTLTIESIKDRRIEKVVIHVEPIEKDDNKEDDNKVGDIKQ